MGAATGTAPDDNPAPGARQARANRYSGRPFSENPRMFQQLPAVVVLLTVLLQAGTAYRVGRARALYGVKAPATSGHELFDRAFRVQMNTLESTLMFLPALWLAASYGAPLWAGIAGLVWVLGRVWYAAGYLRDPARREGGFIVAAIGLVATLLIGTIGLGKALLLG